MLISELINKLKYIQKKEGDLDIKNVNRILYNYNWFSKWIILKE